jgi:ABC-2 type transport system permease protein
MPLLTRLIAYGVKECRVIARDPASLAILFVMPVGFVIIMSLALQDYFQQRVGADRDARASRRFAVVVLDGDGGAIADAICVQLAQGGMIAVTRRAATDFARAAVAQRERVHNGAEQFALLVPAGISQRVAKAFDEAVPAQLLNVPEERKIDLDLLIDPAVRIDQRLLVSGALERVLQGIEIRAALTQTLGSAPAGDAFGGLLHLHVVAPGSAASGAAEEMSLPTSTQQNVSAYSLLAIFMLVVPLSQTFIKERVQGALSRLRSIGVSGIVIVGGKVPPYLLINLLQMALCLAVGRFLLPLLGGEALQLGRSPAGVLVLSAATSLAAIGFALMVSMFARTAEQATAFGATSVLLLAALGGIMVPKTVMPVWLQHFAAFSPLGWAQDGFLALFVRGASFADIVGCVLGLLAFAATCLALALWRFSRTTFEH